jgi:transposase InsO family protein
MLSDRGPQFAVKAFRELLKLFGIKSNLTTAYHPQTDGATEQVNQEIEAYLSIYCSAHPTVRLRNVKAKRLTVFTKVFVVKEVCKNAEEELCITSIRLQSVV